MGDSFALNLSCDKIFLCSSRLWGLQFFYNYIYNYKNVDSFVQ